MHFKEGNVKKVLTVVAIILVTNCSGQFKEVTKADITFKEIGRVDVAFTDYKVRTVTSLTVDSVSLYTLIFNDWSNTKAVTNHSYKYKFKADSATLNEIYKGFLGCLSKDKGAETLFRLGDSTTVKVVTGRALGIKYLTYYFTKDGETVEVNIPKKAGLDCLFGKAKIVIFI